MHKRVQYHLCDLILYLNKLKLNQIVPSAQASCLGYSVWVRINWLMVCNMD